MAKRALDMTNLPYHVLYENGRKTPLPIREGHVLIVHTMIVNQPTREMSVVRTVAFEAEALKGKTVRVGYYPSITSRSPRINLADFEQMGKNELDSHDLRLKLQGVGTELVVEKTSSRPMSITQFSEQYGLNALKTVPYELGRRRLQARERITVNGLKEGVQHVFEWVDAQDHHAETELSEWLQPEKMKPYPATNAHTTSPSARLNNKPANK